MMLVSDAKMKKIMDVGDKNAKSNTNMPKPYAKVTYAEIRMPHGTTPILKGRNVFKSVNTILGKF